MRKSNVIKNTSIAVIGMAAGFAIIAADGRLTTTPAMAGQDIGLKNDFQARPEQAPPRTLLTATAAVAPSPDCAQAAPTRDGDAAPGTALGRGDRVKMSFYEVLPTQDDKWGADRQRLQEPAKAFQLRAELSAEYVVQPDGAVTIPMLGPFQAAGRKPAAFQRQVECSFDAFLGRKGFVNVLSVVKPPIYVVGKVKTAGSYDYTPGMTVLHAIALAGGFDKVPMEPWQVTELTRETTRLQTALDRAMRMIARNTAIEAARTTDQPIVPVELTDLAGKEKASSLVYTEFAPRRAEMVALTSDEAALKGAVDSAAAELELNKSRVPILHQAIEMRRERVDNLSKLLANGTIARPVLMQAQTELMDVQDRSRETMKAINLANDRYNQARQQLQARHDQAQIFVQKDANDARTEAAVAAGEIDAAANVLKAMTRTQLSSASASETEFMIIRRQGDGVTQFTATDTTLLEPGDLVQARSQGAPGARN